MLGTKTIRNVGQDLRLAATEAGESLRSGIASVVVVAVAALVCALAAIALAVMR